LNTKNLINKSTFASKGKNLIKSPIFNQNSFQTSSPTNIDSYSLDKSLNFSGDSISNHLTTSSTSASTSFVNGLCSSSTFINSDNKGFHFLEKNSNINNICTNYLKNGNSLASDLNKNRGVLSEEIKGEEIHQNKLNSFFENNLIKTEQINGPKNFKHIENNKNDKIQHHMTLSLTNPVQTSSISIGKNNSNYCVNTSNSTTICLNLSNIPNCFNSHNTQNSVNNFLNGVSSNLFHNNNFERKKLGKKIKEMKIKHKRLGKEGTYNCGRWQPEEHQRFIEAIMKYGNEWKQVQKHVGTRSSTQARSHAQKFFVKIKKSNVLHLNIDLSKNSIKTLHEMANNLNSDEYFNAIKALNCVAFERKTNNISNCNISNNGNINGNVNNNVRNNHQGKRKVKKEECLSFVDLNNFYFSDLNGNFNIM